MNPSNKLDKKAFISCGLFITGFGLPVSAIINHFLALTTLSSQRHIWMSINDVLAVLFLFFILFHISLSRKPLVKYLKIYSARVFSKELLIASVLIIVLLFAAVFHSFEV
jgi:hypothetical protein